MPTPIPAPARPASFKAQAAISERRLAKKVGRTLRVLVDGTEGRTAVGRSSADAPEIDGLVYIDKAPKQLQSGDFIDVRITRADTYDLYGVPAAA